MKKFIFMCLMGLLLMSPVKAYAAEVPYLTVWIAHPSDYPGSTAVYLHTDSNPEGTFAGTGGLVYETEEWTLRRFILNDVKEDTYWVTVSTADGSFTFPDYIAQGYPDLEQKSVVPELDLSKTTLEVKATPPIPQGDTGLFYYELAPYVCQGNPQFFTVVYPVAEADLFDSGEKLMALFDDLLLAYAKDIKANYAYFDSVLMRIPAHGENDGHFNDYYRLYGPLGVTLEHYAYSSVNEALQCFSECTEVSSLMPGSCLAKICTEYPDTSDAVNAIKNDPANILKDWAWEIYYDTSDPSVLAYDDSVFGICLTDFTFKEDGSKSNICIPLIDNVGIPAGTKFPILSGDTNLLDENGNLAAKEPATEIEIVPTKAPQKPVPTKTPAAPVMELEENNPLLWIVLAVSSVTVCTVAFILYRKKR